MSELLDRIDSPDDVKALSMTELAQLAQDLREVIIDVVSRRGGHLASNLGVTELTVALHKVFDFSRDRLLWDVGHQCYAHKLLTGRREQFEDLRQAGGLSGFPDPAESLYDLFKVGHAGTAISTAMGMALADKALDPDRKVVAVVGDASIVNGLSLEGINNAALLDRQLLVVLNDNSMAIDVTTGAMARALDSVRLNRMYRGFRHATDSMLKHLPMGQNIGDALRHIREGLQTAVHGQQAFEALGFRYFGPIDGHDMGDLVKILQKVSVLDTPVLLHVHTVKGQGYEYAVEDPKTFHSPTSWTIEAGKAVFARPERPSWTSAFSEALLAAAEEDRRICAITAAMPDGTGLAEFRTRFPDRYYDVGICESHAVAMAAGLATLAELREEGFYEQLEAKSAALAAGLAGAAESAGVGDKVFFTRVGSMLCCFFTPGPVSDFATASASNTEAYKAYFHAMLEAGVYLAPSQYEAMFVSIAHGREDIAQTCQVAKAGFAAAAKVL